MIAESLTCVGVVLGYAIRCGDAIGVPFPKPVWDILLGKEGETTLEDFLGADTAMINR